jgi:hypothetical protein
MTIALGIIAEGGIVVAADTEESSGYMKSSEAKILSVLDGVQLGKQTKPNFPTGACLISGAGDSGYVTALMYELAEVFLDKKDLVDKPLQKAFQTCIKDFHTEHIIPFASYPGADRPGVEMLIAFNRNHRSGLLVSEKSAVFRKMPYKAVGIGSVYAEILLHRLWKHADVKTTQILAAYIVFMVKESIEGCGKYTQVTTLLGSTIVPTEESSMLVPAEHPVSHMPWNEIDDLEREFRTTWAAAEKETIWKLVKEHA